MLLEVNQLSKAFGGVKAVDGVSFSFAKGQIGALIGPNGAGKTTLFNLLTGVFKPTSGDIFLQRKPVKGLSTAEISALGVARTFQNLQLFTNMTVLENVMVGCHNRTKTGLMGAAWRFSAREEEKFIRKTSMEMLEKVGLEENADEPAANLPFGQKRLLEIARAMAMQPQVLLLDEPAAGLNPTETRFLVQLINSIRTEGITVILVEHDMETVMELADKIVVLNFGQKIAEGCPAEITCDELVIEAYLGREVDQPA
ncbi:MAG TPA: ABC transporter ATP-binding protein [Verrucomicrobiae bacterium]|nr:ABC transporter ATP-binding protein [Verrucomicrobiae bacterium]